MEAVEAKKKQDPHPEALSQAMPHTTEDDAKQNTGQATRDAEGTTQQLDSGSDSDSDSGSESEMHPLFWTKIPTDENGQAMSDSLKNLIYEDKTSDDLLADFKYNGNEAYKRGKKFYDSALKYYAEALDWGAKGTVSDPDNIKNKILVRSNIAAIQLSKKNYRATIEQCRKAFQLHDSLETTNEEENPFLADFTLIFCLSKARYRSAQAFLCLGKLEEANSHLKKAKALLGRRFDQFSNSEFKTLDAEVVAKLGVQRKAIHALAQTVEKKLAAERKLRLVQEEARKTERLADKKFRSACVLRGIKVGPLIFDISAYTGRRCATFGDFPRPLFSALVSHQGQYPKALLESISKIFDRSTAMTMFHQLKQNEFEIMNWSALIFYPEFGQSDYIQNWSEFTTFEEQLGQVLPVKTGPSGSDLPCAPWDKEGHYCLDSIELYFEEAIVDSFDLSKLISKQVKAFDKKRNEDEELFVNYAKQKRVRVKDFRLKTLLELLTHKKYVIPGIPVFSVVSRRSPFYTTFLSN